jgi:hypothetical protein
VIPAIEPLCDLDARVVFFPVRHHSPACARRVVELARLMKPDAVLIEGPSDFNDRLDELHLPHRLPIAVYSFVRLPGGRRAGAYHPFCIYSPEWQAIRIAKELGAKARFIDLPWADFAGLDDASNRYADAALGRGAYIRSLCKQVGVEKFDDLWDRFFELDAGLELGEFLRRVHHFCTLVRSLDGEASESDRRREAFMAARIRDAMNEFPGRILVVTGGYHSPALIERMQNNPDEPVAAEEVFEGAERGIALTPYSYERLDGLRGYDAGMPNPGFYHQVWNDGVNGTTSHRTLLARVVKMLRKRGQPISAADLIAGESTARGLARLRGHSRVWRQDLIDGVIGALIKDERSYGMSHPLLDAVHEVFRGGERGRLAEGSVLPPLVHDVRSLLSQHELEPEPALREVELNLASPEERERSRILHRLRIVGIAGFQKAAGTDLVNRTDLSRVWERWKIVWSPEHDTTTIESARYGPTLIDAAAARLVERSQEGQGKAETAALLLLDAALAGLPELAAGFLQQLADLIRSDSDFFAVAKSVGHLLHLFVHDHHLETAGRAELASLLAESYGRGLWLFESLGQAGGRDKDLLEGVKTLLEVFERCAAQLTLDRVEFTAVFRRVGTDRRQLPVVRGAAFGALWTIGAADAAEVFAQMLLFADPENLGDFLTGLFALARETAQRHPELVLAIDKLLVSFADEEFQAALPSLRLAFTYFTPREKHHMGLTLLEALGVKERKSLVKLDASPEVMTRAMALESRLLEAMKRYGLRGAS